MPATGLKIVGTGHVYYGVYYGVASPLLFKTVRRCLGIEVMSFGYEILEFWCWNLVSFLPDIGFHLLKSLWSYIFCLMMQKMFSIGERPGLQAGQFSTPTLLLQSHAAVIAALCVLHCPDEIHKAFPEIHVIWRGAYVALKSLGNFQHS